MVIKNQQIKKEEIYLNMTSNQNEHSKNKLKVLISKMEKLL